MNSKKNLLKKIFGRITHSLTKHFPIPTIFKIVPVFLLLNLNFQIGYSQCPMNISTPSGCPVMDATAILTVDASGPIPTTPCINPSDGGCATLRFINIPSAAANGGCPVEFCFVPSKGCGLSSTNMCVFTSNGAGGCDYVGLFAGTEACLSPPAGVTSYEITVCRPGNGPVSFQNLGITDCCTPSLACPNPGIFECDDQAGVNAWLNSAVIVEDCGEQLMIVNDYVPGSLNGCGGSGSQLITFQLIDNFGNILDMCSSQLTVNEPAIPTLACPMPMLSVNCDMADNYVPPPLPYTGTCGLGGVVAGNVTSSNYNTCGGTLTVTYEGTDGCGRQLGPIHCTVTVIGSGPATVHVPNIPDQTCTSLGSLNIPNATYTGTCGNSGAISPMVVGQYDRCTGTTLTVNYSGLDNCGNPISGSTSFYVAPAPMPTVTPPTIPNNLTCEMARTYVAPNAHYGNGLMGACGISGSIIPNVQENWDACGGTITVSYMTTTSAADCGYQLSAGPYIIHVSPAPSPTPSIPILGTPITCIQADNFSAPSGSFDNGETGVCNLSGNAVVPLLLITILLLTHVGIL